MEWSPSNAQSVGSIITATHENVYFMDSGAGAVLVLEFDISSARSRGRGDVRVFCGLEH